MVEHSVQIIHCQKEDLHSKEHALDGYFSSHIYMKIGIFDTAVAVAEEIGWVTKPESHQRLRDAGIEDYVPSYSIPLGAIMFAKDRPQHRTRGSIMNRLQLYNCEYCIQVFNKEHPLNIGNWILMR